MQPIPTEERPKERALRVVIIAAHPDDETIGSGGLLLGLKYPYVVHVTDGAPYDRRFIPKGFRGTREAYAHERRAETIRALAMANVFPSRMFSLGGVDQEACEEIVRLARALSEIIADLRPDIVISHAYEGGHPDHDATCVIAHAACDLVKRLGHFAPPRLVEMASYHGAPGHLVTSELLPRSSEPEPLIARSAREVIAFLERKQLQPSLADASIRLDLSSDDRARKAEMMTCFGTQQEALAPFGIPNELFRLAPEYDFSKPPHEGPLYYEQLGWPMKGIDFRRKALRARRALETEGIRCL